MVKLTNLIMTMKHYLLMLALLSACLAPAQTTPASAAYAYVRVSPRIRGVYHPGAGALAYYSNGQKADLTDSIGLDHGNDNYYNDSLRSAAIFRMIAYFEARGYMWVSTTYDSYLYSHEYYFRRRE
ncbi:MAG: hypothetical protein JST90_17900 [Bacteroidetes bacterium]|nr:hypothetical protein [Bacteroidota bacterium]